MIKHWLWLSSFKGLADNVKLDLVNHFGSVEEVYYNIHDYKNLPSAALSEIANKSLERSENILEMCDRLNISIVAINDSLYPDRLKRIYNPPLILYYKGKLPILDEEVPISVVGLRDCTPYGSNITQKLCYQLAKSGILIVSGMAKGIDKNAHIGALKAGKPTIAVFAGGVDVIYPAENRFLYEDILSCGAVVSENPPGTHHEGKLFPARNRILSGLTVGTLVTEAPVRSGSLITANCAIEQGRDLFVVPGNIDSLTSMGCNNLLKEGATVVTDYQDILVEYASRFPHKITLNRHVKNIEIETSDKPKTVKAIQQISEKTEIFDFTVYLQDCNEQQKLILTAIATEPKNVDELIEITELSPSHVLRELTILELSGKIKEMPGKRFVFTKSAN